MRIVICRYTLTVTCNVLYDTNFSNLRNCKFYTKKKYIFTAFSLLTGLIFKNRNGTPVPVRSRLSFPIALPWECIENSISSFRIVRALFVIVEECDLKASRTHVELSESLVRRVRVNVSGGPPLGKSRLRAPRQGCALGRGSIFIKYLPPIQRRPFTKPPSAAACLVFISSGGCHKLHSSVYGVREDFLIYDRN